MVFVCRMAQMFALWLNCFCYNIRLRIKGVLSLESSPHLTDAETETWKPKFRVGNDSLRVIHAVVEPGFKLGSTPGKAQVPHRAWETCCVTLDKSFKSFLGLSLPICKVGLIRFSLY